jgi:RNA polymerase sigma-70 factor, ECF subfamily
MLEPRAEAQVSAVGRAVAPRERAYTFAEVYDATFAFVWRSARRLGTPVLTVDDVVQETFVIVHRRLGEFEGRSSLRTWLFGILRNVVRAHRRSLLAKNLHAIHPESAADLEALRDAAPGPHEIVAQAEAVRLVDQLLEALDEEKREVFVLAELEQMTAPEIAAALAIPVNTVYSRLRIARHEFAAAAARHRARDERRTR